MKKTLIIIYFTLLLTPFLSAQKNETITVNAGMRVQDCITNVERYRYPDFTRGNVFYKNGAFSGANLNYNFLNAEMEFLQTRDTLSIANPAEIEFITIANDTFFYDNGYLELIRNGQVKVAVKRYFKMNDVKKKDSYGNSGSLAATTAYSSLHTSGAYYKLMVNRDMVFEKISEYCLAVSNEIFVPFNKKQVMKLYPKKKETIQDYLNSNKIDFHSKDDLLRFADYLSAFYD